MTDVIGILTVFGTLVLFFWLGWVMMSIVWNIFSKTSKFIDSMFSSTDTDVYMQEINRLNEQYDNLVEEHKRVKFEEASKLLY